MLNRVSDGATVAQDNPVRYILYSETADHNLTRKLGCAEYSYFFVRDAFRKFLEPRGFVDVVTDPEIEVDRIYDESTARGEKCVFLSFAPPHRTLLSLRCPTIPVFAWEFDTIPTETWDSDWRNDWRNDWRKVLAQLGCAITHSAFSARIIRDAMGADFPVVSIPAPIWERVQRSAEAHTEVADLELQVRNFLDTRLSRTLLPQIPTMLPKRRGLFAKWKRSIAKRFARVPASALPEPLAQTIRFSRDEVIYTSIFNPYDGRKNWPDMLSAFCIALSNCPDATLVLKLVHFDASWVFADMRTMLSRYPMFTCRVVIICDFLETEAYNKLIAASKYTVNASLGEGQCLPLMESMSWGKPALAPQHTAMSEYHDESTGFIIETSLESCAWPHDPRAAVRACRHRVNWETAARAFLDSFNLVKADPQQYARMSANSIESQRKFCSEAAAFEKLELFTNAILKNWKKKRVLVPAPGNGWSGMRRLSASPPSHNM